MGGSGNWMKTFIGFKKAEKQATNADEKLGGGKGKRWKLWRSPSGDLSTWKKGFKARRHRAEVASEGADSPSRNDAFNAAAYASVVRAPPRDFRVVREERAAIRIQTTFRGFLAGILDEPDKNALTEAWRSCCDLKDPVVCPKPRRVYLRSRINKVVCPKPRRVYFRMKRQAERWGAELYQEDLELIDL